MKIIKFLFAGNFEIQGRDRHFEKDEILQDISDEDADRLIAGLCALEVAAFDVYDPADHSYAPKKKGKKEDR